MTQHRWTETDVPDQHGRMVVVTGANTGLGFETARIMAQHGAAVVLACRSIDKATEAARRIRAAVPGSSLSPLALDLSSLASVRGAADQLHAERDRIDLLVNNAGMLGSSERTRTADGFEATFATNHLGVFAFTGLVLDLLLPVAGSRVVTVSSQAHRLRSATLDFNDLQFENRYRRDAAYGRSKLANLLFTYELQRRLTTARSRTSAVAAHPGQSRTDFTRGMSPVARFVYGPRLRHLTGLVMQDRTVGVLSEVRAAVDPQVPAGSYYGPSGPFQLTGHPVRTSSNARSHDAVAQRRLWAESERLTDVRYPLDR